MSLRLIAMLMLLQPVTLFAEEWPPKVTVEKLLSMPVEGLGVGYLVFTVEVGWTEVAATGDVEHHTEVAGKEVVVNEASAEKWLARFTEYRDIFGAAIEKRGYSDYGGTYDAKVSSKTLTDSTA